MKVKFIYVVEHTAKKVLVWMTDWFTCCKCINPWLKHFYFALYSKIIEYGAQFSFYMIIQFSILRLQIVPIAKTRKNVS